MSGFGTDDDWDPVSNSKQTGSRGGVMMRMSGRKNKSVHGTKKKKLRILIVMRRMMIALMFLLDFEVNFFAKKTS